MRHGVCDMKYTTELCRPDDGVAFVVGALFAAVALLVGFSFAGLVLLLILELSK